jgi:uncharacterized protein (UPF0264 family)
MTALLVSVRSAAEARTALAGGAALIDIKEPARGALGRADAAVIHEVVAAVAGRRPVSAALGEWLEGTGVFPATADLTYVKWGLAGCARQADWRHGLDRALGRPSLPRLVLTAYADWQCARAPSVEEVFTLARAHPDTVLLVDTYCKDAAVVGKPRPTLLDWLPTPWIGDLCARCRAIGVKIALAGSLGPEEIRVLAPARPDWFAVRGAVCDGDRHGTVQVEKVQQLVALATAY